MKKIFTLISLVCFAMGVSAQEVYKSVEVVTNTDGSESYVLAPEFKAVVGEDGKTANNVENNKSIVKFSTANVEGEAVGSGIPADAASGTGVDITADGVVNSWKSIMWEPSKRRIVKDGDVIVGRSLNVAGSGVPFTAISAKPYVKDDVVYEGSYVAVYTYYNPDGSLGLPIYGLYYRLTPKVNGTFKVGIWSNKDNRKTFVVEESSKLPVAYEVEGYMNSDTYSTAEEIKKIHNDRWTTDGVDSNPYVIGNGNQFWGYLTFTAEANKTYWLFQESSQLGFGGYEFTAGSAGINDIKNDVDKNAPKYNLAGQRVDNNYKGVVIQNGKKFMNK